MVSQYTRGLVDAAQIAEDAAKAKREEARRDFAAKFDTAANKSVAVAEALAALAARLRAAAGGKVSACSDCGADVGMTVTPPVYCGECWKKREAKGDVNV